MTCVKVARLAGLGMGLLLIGCASQRPVLFDSANYKKSPDKAEAAIDDCIKRAEAAGAQGESQLERAAYNSAAGGVGSAAAGGAGAAAANAFGHSYDVTGSIGASAAAGAVGNFALSMFDNSVDPTFANYVQSCLSEKGYKVIGWK